MKDLIISNAFKSVQSTIHQRKTTKVLAEQSWTPALNEAQQKVLIDELLRLAAHAPYHYKSAERYKQDVLNSSLPFRAYTLDATTCRRLAEQLKNSQPPAGKILNMLWAAEALLIFTWLPDVFGEQPKERTMEPLPFTGNLRNMEHIAATSAAITNVLLGATAEGFPNYWSSGGSLRQQSAREILGISLDEIMLGCLFVFPKDALERGAEVKPGKLRNEGKDLHSWSKAVEL